MSHTLGIDLGSTMARAAVCTDSGPRLLDAVPAVVAFPRKSDAIVGELARRQAYINPSRSFTNLLSHLQSPRRWEVDGHFYSSVEITGILLRELRATAQEAMGSELRRCVFSVPDHFGWEERRALREAAALAGLHVEGFLVESCAAVLGSGLLESGAGPFLLCDAGGGSFRASVLEKGSHRVQLRSGVKNDSCGGNGFDSCIAAWLLQRFREEQGLDLSRDVNAMQRIMEAAELAKRRLSDSSITTISLPYITAEKDEPLHMDYSLSRSLFYELSARLIRELGQSVEQALEEGGGARRILLCGGGAVMPALRQAVGRAAILPAQHEGCTALGAAIAAKENYITRETAMA